MDNLYHLRLIRFLLFVRLSIRVAGTGKGRKQGVAITHRHGTGMSWRAEIDKLMLTRQGADAERIREEGLTNIRLLNENLRTKDKMKEAARGSAL